MSNSAPSVRCRSRDDDTHWWIAYAQHSSVDGTSGVAGNGALRTAAIVAAARALPIDGPETTEPRRADKVGRP